MKVSPPPPKLPRPGTALPHRDVYERKTPAAGVAVQIAPPTDRTRRPNEHDLARTDWGEGSERREPERTPVGATAIEAIDFRTEKMRVEHREDMTVTNERLFAMAGAIADVRVGVAKELGDIREDFATRTGALDTKMEGIVVGFDMLNKTLLPLLTQQQQTMTVTTTSQVKVSEAKQLDLLDGKKWSREMWAKVLALFGAGGLASTLIIMLAAGKC